MTQLRIDDGPPTSSRIVRLDEFGQTFGSPKTVTPCGCISCPSGTLHDVVYEVDRAGVLFCERHIAAELKRVRNLHEERA